MTPVRLHVRERGDGEDAGSGAPGGAGTRFLVDLDLSRLGRLQLDGLVRDRRMDLMVRSETPLERSVESGLIQTVDSALQAIGYSGGLAFRSGPHGWVELAESRAARSGDPVQRLA